MKVNQIVGEHKKGYRAKKYAQKPKQFIEPVKPQAPVSPEEQRKQAKESMSETQPGGMVGKVSQVNQAAGTATITGPDGQAKTVDLSQLKPGENNTLTLNTPDIAPGTVVNAEKNMEEGPEVPYYVDVSSGTPMAKTAPKPTQIVPSKMWTAITPDIEAKAGQQGFRKVLLQFNNKQFHGLEGGDKTLGSKIIVSPTDFQSLTTPAVKESPELLDIKKLSGL